MNRSRYPVIRSLSWCFTGSGWRARQDSTPTRCLEGIGQLAL